MRLSDWSSDVCSSDLQQGADRRHLDRRRVQGAEDRAQRAALLRALRRARHSRRALETRLARARGAGAQAQDLSPVASLRSEEHTSELQSLMRISYAVFCLKKKITKKSNI